MSNYLNEAVDYALTNGLLKYNSYYELTHAPFSLTPFPVSAELQQQMNDLTPVFNALWMNIANNTEFLRTALEKTAQTDQFIARLLELLPAGKPASSHQLLISRNDFLLTETDSGLLQPKQVEFNTISNSFLALSKKVSMMHRFLNHKGIMSCLPVIYDPMEEAVDAMAQAIKIYDYPGACMLMVVQEPEQNIFDQRAIEYRLLEKYHIQTLRMTLEEITETGRLKEGHLIINGQVAGLVYFRAGYTPDDYEEPEAWKARELIENGSCIKCPTIGMQLAGAKKIQQLLGNPETLAMFAEKESINAIQETFVGSYTLDESINGVSATEAACTSPDRFVLKPQREGGGNNLYGNDMVQTLSAMSPREKDAYILMERIESLVTSAELIVESTSETLPSISEIGWYGICLAEDREIIENRDAGYLVRTKSAEIDEGGVCAGYACLNSLCLNE